MSVKELEAIYNSNNDFKDYVDSFLRTKPEMTRETLFTHKIIAEIAEYYIHKNDGRV